MTAAATTHKVPPASPLAIIMFTLAVTGTILVIPHVIISSMNGWPPQLMTLHAVATVGFWLAGFHYRAHPPRTLATAGPDTLPGPQRHNRDDLAAGFAALDEKELKDLEDRLRGTDG